MEKSQQYYERKQQLRLQLEKSKKAQKFAERAIAPELDPEQSPDHNQSPRQNVMHLTPIISESKRSTTPHAAKSRWICSKCGSTNARRLSHCSNCPSRCARVWSWGLDNDDC